MLRDQAHFEEKELEHFSILHGGKSKKNPIPQNEFKLP